MLHFIGYFIFGIWVIGTILLFSGFVIHIINGNFENLLKEKNPQVKQVLLSNNGKRLTVAALISMLWPIVALENFVKWLGK